MNMNEYRCTSSNCTTPINDLHKGHSNLVNKYLSVIAVARDIKKMLNQGHLLFLFLSRPNILTAESYYERARSAKRVSSDIYTKNLSMSGRPARRPARRPWSRF